MMTTTSSSGPLLESVSDIKSDLVIQTDPNAITPEPSSPTDNKAENKKQFSSSSSSRDDVKELDPRDRRLVYVAGLQLILGAMSLIWASAVVSNDASLGGASAAAALISGLAALAGGASGLIARHSKRRNKSAHRAATACVALAAITVAACSLVMALSATGLLRDGNRGSELVTWVALLSNTGLLLTAGLLAACSVASGALWRRDAGICTSRGHRSRPEDEPLPGTPPVPHKHGLVSKWLGQQQPAQLFMISPMAATGGSVYSSPGAAPHIIPLHVPPPPMSPLAIPPYILQAPMGPPPPCMLHSMTLPHRERRRSRKHQRRMSTGQPSIIYPPDAMLEPRDPIEAAERAEKACKRQRLPCALTEEEMERSYTGLDRAIAEQFITDVMEKHRGDDVDEDEEHRRRISTTSSARLSSHRDVVDETF